MEERLLRRFFDTKWNHGPCPVCQTDAWQVGGEIGEMGMSESYGTDITMASSAYPLYPIFCTNCGYTLLFSALIAGLVPNADTDKPEDEVGP